jgi:hypothetical protein
MQIVGKLSPLLATHAIASLRPAHEIELVQSWDALHTTLTTRRPSAILLEPSAEDGEHDHHVATLRRRHPSVPVIAYTPCTHRSVQRVLGWSTLGIHSVVLHGVRDTEMHLRNAVEASEINPLATRLLDELSEPLQRMPERLHAAVCKLFLQPHTIRSAPRLASIAGLTRRATDKHIHRAGLAPAHTLISAASLLWTYHLIQTSGTPLVHIAVRLGHQTPRILNRHADQLLHLRPGCWRAKLSEKELIRLLLSVTWPASSVAHPPTPPPVKSRPTASAVV